MRIMCALFAAATVGLASVDPRCPTSTGGRSPNGSRRDTAEIGLASSERRACVLPHRSAVPTGASRGRKRSCAHVNPTQGNAVPVGRRTMLPGCHCNTRKMLSHRPPIHRRRGVAPALEIRGRRARKRAGQHLNPTPELRNRIIPEMRPTIRRILKGAEVFLFWERPECRPIVNASARPRCGNGQHPPSRRQRMPVASRERTGSGVDARGSDLVP